MIRLVLMRHGESTSDLEPRRIEGMADFPLTDQGRLQANALGKRIAAEYHLDELICSPLVRARQTAEAISAATGIAVQVDARLREKSFGLLGGLTFTEADEQYPSVNWRSPRAHDLFPEGESFLEQFARAADFWFALCHGADNRTVGVVTHGGTIQALYRAALGLPVNTPHSFLNGDTCVHEWWVEPGGRSVKVLKSNCTYHLRSLPGA